MSEHRYFQNRENLVCTPVDASVAHFDSDTARTEVQVAPLDAIVIRREELPEVVVDNYGLLVGGVLYGSATEGARALRSRAMAQLAVAEHASTHPPVDPEQVEALAKDLSRVVEFGTTTPYADAAERLIRAGWSK